MRKTGILLVLFLLSLSTFSQTFFEIGWNQIHDISMDDKAYSIIRSPMGFLVAGTTDRMTGEGSKVLLCKINDQGDMVWNKSLGEGSYDFKDMAGTPQGEYVLLAGSEGENRNIHVFKVNQAGDLDWNTFLGADEKDVANRILGADDGGFVVCGAKEIQGDHDTDGWLVKLNKKGKMDWQGLYGKRYSNDEIRTMVDNPDGGYYLAGSTHADLRKPQVPFIVSVDERGKNLWEKNFADLENFSAEYIYLDKDGFVILVAESLEKGSNRIKEIRVLKLNQVGLKMSEYSIPVYDGCTSPNYYISDNQLFVFFDILDAGDKYNGSVVMRVDNAFQPVWIRRLVKSDPHVKNIISTGDNKYIAIGWKVTGESYVSDINVISITDHSDKLLGDYVSKGQQEWEQKRADESDSEYSSRMEKNKQEIEEALILEAQILYSMADAPEKTASTQKERPAGGDQMVFRSGGSGGENLLMGTYYGLLIAVNDYDDPNITDLDQPVKDAEKLYQVLIDEYLFEKINVTFLKNPTREDIINALDRLEVIIKEEDNLLVFYAGHGYWDEKTKKGYWLPSDADQFSTANWIRNSSISGYIRGINSRHTLLIADACFSGSIFKTRSAFGSANMAISRLNDLPSRKAMTSGTLKEVPDQSVFVEYLVKRLYENKDEYLPSEQLFFSFKPAVLNNSDNIPQFGEIKDAGDEGGDFIFKRK